MPEVCRFYGIVIRMFYSDHNPPHFHVEYGNDVALIEIATGSVLEGSLPRRALNLVTEWVELQREALSQNWQHALRHEPLLKIPPLE